MTNLDSILKSRDITLLTKIHIVKAVVFPVVTYRCEHWAIKKAECWRIYAFKLWCWRRLLRDPWTARRSHQWILKETNPEYSLGGVMLKLKLQYSGHLMFHIWLIRKDADVGKDWRQEEKGTTEDKLVGCYHWPNGHEFEQALGDGEGQGSLACCSPWGCKESNMTEQLNNKWTAINEFSVIHNLVIHLSVSISSMPDIMSGGCLCKVKTQTSHSCHLPALF